MVKFRQSRVPPLPRTRLGGRADGTRRAPGTGAFVSGHRERGKSGTGGDARGAGGSGVPGADDTRWAPGTGARERGRVPGTGGWGGDARGAGGFVPGHRERGRERGRVPRPGGDARGASGGGVTPDAGALGAWPNAKFDQFALARVPALGLQGYRRGGAGSPNP